MLESKVQRKLIEALNDRGYAVLRLHPSELHFPNNKKVMRNGLPDLMAFKKRKLVFIEVKRKGETFEPIQYVFSKMLRVFGIKSIVFRDGDDIDKLL